MAANTAAAKKAAFLAQAKKSVKGLNEARKAKPSDTSLPAVEPGRYKWRLKHETEIGQKGTLKGHAIARIVAIKAETDDGGEEGVKVRQMYDLSREATETFNPLANYCRDLKRVLPGREEEIDNVDGIGELVAIAEDLNGDDSPIIWGTISDSESNGKTYRNIRFEEPVEEGSAPSKEETGADAGEIDPDEPGADDEVNVEDDVQVEDEAAEWTPAKGDKASFVFRGKKIVGELASANKAEKTARLKAKDTGRVYGPIKWEQLTLIEAAG